MLAAYGDERHESADAAGGPHGLTRGVPRGFHAWALAVAVLVAVASTWPIAAHLYDHVVDGALIIDPKHPQAFGPANIGADVLTTTWIVNWMLHALVTQPLEPFDANIFYPAPLASGYTEHLFATDLLGAPGRIVGGPVMAHQTALLLCLVLTAWTTAYVVTRWSGSILGGLVAGTLFAASPFHQGQMYHLQSLGTAYLPLVVLGLERFNATGWPKWAGVAGVAVVLQILSGQYLGYFALVTASICGVCCLVAGRAGAPPWRGRLRDAAWLTAAGIGAGMLALPFVLPYLRLSQRGEIPPSANLMLNQLYHLAAYRPHGTWQWPGIPAPAWILAIIGAIALVVDGRAGRVRAAMLVLVGVVGAILSLGTHHAWDIWTPLSAVVPGFASMREPIRFTVLPCLVGALFAGCGAAVLTRRHPFLGAVAVSLAIGAAVQAWRGPLPLRRLPVGDALPEVYRRLVRCGDGDPLVELPMAMRLDSFRDATPQYFSTFHWLPLLNGRAGYAPPMIEDVRRAANQTLLTPGGLDHLRALTGVRWVLVHCRESRSPVVRQLCSGTVWRRFASRRFGVGADEVVLFDLGRVATLPRPVPRRSEPTAGCLDTVASVR